MLFNSFEFIWFLPLAFTAYWLIGKKQVTAQNGFLLVASYVFYGWWDSRFLFLIVGSSIMDYVIGIGLGAATDKKDKNFLLGWSIAFNLGLLGVFKYCNFFIAETSQLLAHIGLNPNVPLLNIILPVGISFYTFQTMSYTIDIYRGKLKPTRDIIAFFAYISFFPQLVAGPIERATNLLPQFLKERTFNYNLAKDGMRQILWGLFKKIVIADGCAVMVNEIFDQGLTAEGYAALPGAVLLMGAVYFAFQIYGDFSGYSDIAIGVAKLFGFNLMRNFAYPYFSRDIAEFWRRWHISLSTWFRDYLYIPLGGSRGSMANKINNVMVIFLVSGFWHGANMTYIAWGFVNALYFIPLMVLKTNRSNMDNDISERFFPRIGVLAQILFTFTLTCFAWVFFRASSIELAGNYILEIFTGSFFPENAYYFHPLILFLLGAFIAIEWTQRRHLHPLKMDHLPTLVRWPVYITLIVVTLYSTNFHEAQEFIYFQF